MIRLQLFGPPALRDATGEAVGGTVAQRQRVALLALLAVAGESGVSRDRLIALLWPELDGEHARHLLSNSLYGIRKSLGNDVVIGRGDVLLLNPARIRSDVGEFAELIERGDDAAAVDLGEAPFLDGFYLQNAGDFERWAEAERSRFARTRLGALERLATNAEATHDARAALMYWQRLSEADPYNSRVVLRLMRAYAAGGEPAGALELARAHRSVLADELNTALPAEIADLVAQLSRRAADETILPTRAGPLHTVSRPRRPAAGSQSLRAHAPQPSIRGWPRLTWRRAGAASLILVATALAATAVVSDAFRMGRPAPATASVLPRSIAVLPFVNLGAASSDDYFSDGLTEELLNHLAQVEGLRVAARTSVFAYKGVNKDVGDIARALNVGLIVEGSVRRTGRRLRVTAQLVNAADGYHIWSRTWDEEDLADIFEIQEEISRQIVSNVLPQLRDQSPYARGTQDVHAYEEYLRGRFAFWQGTSPENMRSAINHYQNAIARDPRYAAAYAGLADAYMLSPGPPRQKLEAAKVAAQRAIELDSELSEGYVALASINWFYDWDWAAAERNYRRSFSVNRPIYSRCICYVWYLAAIGDMDGAAREAARARSFDPVSLLPMTTLASVYLSAGRRQELRALLPELRAAGMSERGLDGYVAWLEWDEGRRDAALALASEGMVFPDSLATANSWWLAMLAYMYAGTGKTSWAERIAETLDARTRADYVEPLLIASAYAAAGDTARASRWVRHAFQERENLAFYAVLPETRPLQTLPAFHQALRAAHVPLSSD